MVEGLRFAAGVGGGEVGEGGDLGEGKGRLVFRLPYMQTTLLIFVEDMQLLM